MYDIFSLPEFHFPKDFLFGSATAGHQIEGDNIYSQYWFTENQPGYRGVRSGKACNHYAMFRDDVAMIASLGHKAYRLSLEWSRIEPVEGEWCQEALDHYKELLELLQKKGIRTFVTLCHWTWPQWFEEKGGMTKKENIPFFLRYAEKAVRFLDEYVDFWMIFNEKTHTLIGEVQGFNYVRAHGMTYRMIKSLTSTPVSSAHMALQYFPCRFYDELDRLMTAWNDYRATGFFLHALQTGELAAPGIDAEECPECKDAVDFWALNLYTREMTDSRRKNLYGDRHQHKILKMIPQNFYLEEMYPEGLTAMLERFRNHPVYVTENGCSCDDDRFRIVYISLYLSAMYEAMQKGVDVRGYLYWSLMDNYEWGSYVPRFGLVDVDFKTFKRTPKPSAEFYREIIRENGFTQQILRKYLKEMPSLSK